MGILQGKGVAKGISWFSVLLYSIPREVKWPGEIIRGAGLVSLGTFDSVPPIFDNDGMARKRPYDISYDEATGQHLGAIDSKYHSLVRETIEEQLRFEPRKETRNRKPLRQPAPFEAT